MDWDERRHIVDYDSAVAIRYHGHRKAFLDWLSRFGPAMSVLFGSAAFSAAIVGHPQTAAGASLAVAAFGAANLTFGWGERARLHERLFKEWALLNGKVATLDANDEAGLRVLEGERAKLDADSPNQLYALSALCENEEKGVRRAGDAVHINWLQSAVVNWFTLPGWRAHPLA